jgi:diguanylate cyclase (GGDEF)-like protein
MRSKTYPRRSGTRTVVVRRLALKLWELKRELAEARAGASIDPLTKALNRRGFLERFLPMHAHARRQTDWNMGCLLFLDIDHFKSVNDTYGHIAGDAALVALVHTIQENLRREDILFRYGGEEFGILMPGADIAQAVRAAERLRVAVQNSSCRSGHHEMKFTISIGVAGIKASDNSAMSDFEAGVAVADRCLYDAKKSGRNCVRFPN